MSKEDASGWSNHPSWKNASLEEIIQIVRAETRYPLEHSRMLSQLLLQERKGPLNEDQVEAIRLINKYVEGTDELIAAALELVKERTSNSLKNSKDDD